MTKIVLLESSRGIEPMLESYKRFWANSFAFGGKTGRAEFWLALASNAIAIGLLIMTGALLVALLGDSAGTPPAFIFLIAYGIAAIIPNFSIQIRRLRDAGFNPWMILLSLVPYLGGIILFVMYLQPSKQGSV